MYTHTTIACSAANTNHVLQRRTIGLHFNNVGDSAVYIKLNSTGTAASAAGRDQHIQAGMNWSVEATQDVYTISLICAAGETTTVSMTEQSYRE